MTPTLPAALDPRSYALDNVWAALNLAAALVVCAFTLFVVVKQPRNRIARALALDLAALIGLLAGEGLLRTTANVAVADELARPGLALFCLSGPLQLLFSVRLSGFEARARWRSLRDLGFGVASGLAFLVVATDLFTLGVQATPWGFLLVPGPLYAVLLVFYGLYWLASLFPLWQAARRARLALTRRRLYYILAASILVGLAGGDSLMAYGGRLPPLGFAAALAATLVLSYAVVQHRIMDISTALHRTAIRVVISLLAFAPLYLLVRTLRRWLASSGPGAVALVVLIAFLLARDYFARVQPLIDRVLARRRRQLERAVRAFADRAAELAGPAALAEDVSRTVAEALHAETRAILLRTADGWRRVFPTEEALGATEDRLVERLGPRAEVVALAELGEARFRVIERSAERLCQRYRAATLLPLVHHGEFAGVIALGPQPGERSPTQDEIEFLERLRTAATVAFVNAQLYEETERRAATLEAEVRARTAELARKLETLQQAQADLAQAEKMASLGMLVAGVSHEINNALTFVYGNLPTLRKYLDGYERVLDAWQEAARGDPAEAGLSQELEALRYRFVRGDTGPLVAAMEEGARRARLIVGDLRSFVRHDEALVGVVDVREGLDSTLNLLRGGFAARIEFRREYAAELPRIECHPAQLNQVFLNLLVGAAEGISGRGEVRVRAEPAEGDGVLVTIEDRGDGAAPAESERRSASPSSPHRQSGAGLGLTVCRTIIERHGGRIELDQSQPRGTCVRIRLPRRAATPPPRAAS
jgi:signal transduction histidine kinase